MLHPTNDAGNFISSKNSSIESHWYYGRLMALGVCLLSLRINVLDSLATAMALYSRYCTSALVISASFDTNTSAFCQNDFLLSWSLTRSLKCSVSPIYVSGLVAASSPMQHIYITDYQWLFILMGTTSVFTSTQNVGTNANSCISSLCIYVLYRLFSALLWNVRYQIQGVDW